MNSTLFVMDWKKLKSLRLDLHPSSEGRVSTVTHFECTEPSRPNHNSSWRVWGIYPNNGGIKLNGLLSSYGLSVKEPR